MDRARWRLVEGYEDGMDGEAEPDWKHRFGEYATAYLEGYFRGFVSRKVGELYPIYSGWERRYWRHYLGRMMTEPRCFRR